MSTVNFSVPEEIKAAFNATFADRNRSAIIAELMQEAVEREQRHQRRREAAARIRARHADAPEASSAELAADREAGRP